MSDSDTWDAICSVCSTTYQRDSEGGPYRIFKHAALEVKQPVCPACINTTPCTANWQGIHGEIVDIPDWAAGQVGAIPADSIPDEWDLHHCAIPLTQLGFCRVCYLWMRWDVPTQRWRDLNPLEAEDRYLLPMYLASEG